jgi:hypothetical protein
MPSGTSALPTIPALEQNTSEVNLGTLKSDVSNQKSSVHLYESKALMYALKVFCIRLYRLCLDTHSLLEALGMDLQDALITYVV